MRDVGPDVRRREVGGQDRLERQLGVPKPPTALAWFISQLRTRSALGLTPALTPAIVFLPLGVLLGPHALNWLSARVLDRLDPIITLGLVILGVLVGVGLGREFRRSVRLFLAASLESVVTIGAVIGATAYFALRTGVPLAEPVAGVIIALGLGASSSSATTADPDLEPAAGIGTRIADLDDVLPIVILAVVLSWLSVGWPLGRWMAPAAACGIGLVMGLVGWLVFERASSTPERVVFLVGTLALGGGAALSLHVSPLVAGLVGGAVWSALPGRADRLVQDDLRQVQHPMVVVLLMAAGALASPSRAVLWLLAPYVLFRLVGKVVGAWITGSWLDISPVDLAAYLMPPGVLGIAFALDLRHLLPPTAGDVVVATVAAGTAIFELVALFLMPLRRRGSA
jgi:hypothetical protein